MCAFLFRRQSPAWELSFLISQSVPGVEAKLSYFTVSTQLGNHLRYFVTKAASTGAPDNTG